MMATQPTLRPMPIRMKELWDWVCAASAYDFGDPGPLAELISKEPVPTEFRRMLGDVVAGTRPLPRRGKGNSKIAARDRLRIAAGASVIFDMLSAIRKNAIAIADQKQLEPTAVIAMAAKDRSAFLKDFAAGLCVSAETVENLMRDLQARIDRWPEV